MPNPKPKKLNRIPEWKKTELIRLASLHSIKTKKPVHNVNAIADKLKINRSSARGIVWLVDELARTKKSTPKKRQG